MYKAFCPKCGELINVDRVHNGIGFVFHAVHCGYGQDCFSDIFHVEKTGYDGNMAYQATFEEYDGGDDVSNGKTELDAINDLLERQANENK